MNLTELERGLKKATSQIIDFLNSGKGVEDLPEPVQSITTYDFAKKKYKEVQYIPLHDEIDTYSRQIPRYRVNVMDWSARRQLPGIELVEKGFLTKEEKKVWLENFPLTIQPAFELKGELAEGISLDDFGSLTRVVQYDEKFGMTSKVLVSALELHYESGDVLVFSDSIGVVGDFVERPDPQRYRRVLLNGEVVHATDELVMSYHYLWFSLSFGREAVKTRIRLYPLGREFEEKEFLALYNAELRNGLKRNFLNRLWVLDDIFELDGRRYSHEKFLNIFGEYLENLGITESDLYRVQCRYELYS